MNIALWIAQGLVAFAMLAAGTLKLVTPRLKLAEKMKWPATWTDGSVKLLGLAEVLGAVGLVVPWVTRIDPFLTPLAALCLLPIMLGAIRTHLALKESPAPPAILGILCAFIALGRSDVL